MSIGKNKMKNRVVFTFGRFNPPTIGHEKLIKKVESVAKGGTFYIYPSWTQNAKKDPLPHKVKFNWMKKIFPKYAKNIISDPLCKTAIHVLTKYEDFDTVAMVVGSDRVSSFQKLFDKYNGVESTHGFYEFDKIEVISAGDRDPDAQGVEGMSASKMRLAATNNDFESFELGVPNAISDTEKKNLFNDVRKHMGINETLEYGTDELRKHCQQMTPHQPVVSYVKERSLTSTEEKKKEEILKALKLKNPDWDSNKKTRNKIYAIATAQAKKLREGSMLKTYEDIVKWVDKTTLSENISDLPTSLKKEARELVKQAANLGGIVYHWLEDQEINYAEDWDDFNSWPGQEAIDDKKVEIIYTNA